MVAHHVSPSKSENGHGLGISVAWSFGQTHRSWRSWCQGPARLFADWHFSTSAEMPAGATRQVNLCKASSRTVVYSWLHFAYGENGVAGTLFLNSFRLLIWEFPSHVEMSLLNTFKLLIQPFMAIHICTWSDRSRWFGLAVVYGLGFTTLQGISYQ